MAGATFVIFPSSDSEKRWHIGVDDGTAPRLQVVELDGDVDENGNDSAHDPRSIARAMLVALKQLQYAGEGVTLALPSRWCLCAPISTAALPRRGRGQAMLYRLEEKLPLAAEELVADYLAGPGDQSLGVCCERQKVAEIVTALEAAGIAVESICPVALLAAQSRLAANRSGALDAILWRGASGETLELLVLSGAKLIAWQHLAAREPKDVILHLRLRLAEGREPPLRVAALDLRDDGRVLPDLYSLPHQFQVVETIDVNLLEEATRCAAAIAAGRLSTTTIELRSGALAVTDPYRQVRRSLTASLVAATLLLVCVSVSFLWRAHNYQQMARSHESEQQQVFRRTLPGQSVPVAVRSRLLSEERRLRGLSGEDAHSLPLQASALALLHDALARLPTDLRYRVLELRLSSERLYLEGQARSHADAEIIASALRKQQGFTVEPPRSEQLKEKGVAFTLSGVPPAQAQVRAPLPAAAAAAAATMPAMAAHREGSR